MKKDIQDYLDELEEKNESHFKEDFVKLNTKKYGFFPQVIVTIEECSEVIKSFTKVLRRGATPEMFSEQERISIIEEIADVEIMLVQIKYMCKIEEEVEKVKLSKMKRTIERWK